MEQNRKKGIFIGNLHNSVTEKDLIKIFQPYGTIIQVNYIWHRSGPLKGQPKGFAFIEFQTEDEAKNSLEANEMILKGRKIVVKFEETSNKMNQSNQLRDNRKRRRVDEQNTNTTTFATTDLSTPEQAKKTLRTIDEQIMRLKVRYNTFKIINFLLSNYFLLF